MINVIEQMSTNVEIIAYVNGKKIQSMIDTGTRQTVLRRSEYERIGKAPLRPTTSTFQGFGSAIVKADGVFRTIITIHNEEYNTEVYVVPDYATCQAMLLGKDLTRRIDVNIRGG